MWIPPVHSPLTALDALGALWGREGDLVVLGELLRARFDAEGVLLTGSGTQALRRAIEIAGAATPDDRRLVALPAYGCYDLASALLGAGLPAVLYDLDPRTLGPDPASLRQALARGAGVMVAANLYGVPLDWHAIDAVAREFGAVVIEDAAQAVGSSWQGRPAGSLADLSVLSFGRGKGWTGGGGGALLARGRFGDVDLERPALESGGRRAGEGLVMAGRSLAQWALARPALYGLPARVPALGLGETHFRPPEPVAAMAPYPASLVRHTARHIDRETDLRHDRADRLGAALDRSSVVQQVEVPAGGDPSWLRFPVRVDGLPDVLPRQLHRLGVYRGYPQTLAQLPALAPRLDAAEVELPGAHMLATGLVTLPTHRRVPIDRLLSRLPVALERALRTPSPDLRPASRQ